MVVGVILHGVQPLEAGGDDDVPAVMRADRALHVGSERDRSFAAAELRCVILNRTVTCRLCQLNGAGGASGCRVAAGNSARTKRIGLGPRAFRIGFVKRSFTVVSRLQFPGEPGRS